MGKQPYRVTPKEDEVFSLAGIWSSLKKESKEVHTFSILTMKPNSKMSELHDRMPVILKGGRDMQWINGSLEKKEIHKYPSDLMEVQKVSKKVNNPSNDSEKVLSPDSRQTRLGEPK
jgi:putative SOS response-associated peptidase YedK